MKRLYLLILFRLLRVVRMWELCHRPEIWTMDNELVYQRAGRELGEHG